MSPSGPACCLISCSSWSLGSSCLSLSSPRSGTLKVDPSPLTGAASLPLVVCFSSVACVPSSEVILSPRRRACVASTDALMFLKGTVFGTMSSRNSRLSWCDTALAGCTLEKELRSRGSATYRRPCTGRFDGACGLVLFGCGSLLRDAG